MSTNIPPVLEPGAQIVDAHDVGESSDTLPVEHGSSPELEEVDETEGNLESHEVIELQAFIDRKEWIEEKIKFLEGLPTIDVFAGMDDLSKPLEEICGLATRAQLNEWIAEHDKIEKETESFDSGDLRKLKKFTKAATQRNLSPADTDLIEITLTTLFALDKLLHLLRNRSEQLDHLGLRLTWEEHRAGAYETRRQFMSDLETYLKARARWTHNVYSCANMFPKASNEGTYDGTLKPKITEDGFSRSARFKLAEDLSRDAALFSSRVIALRHGDVAASGKILDKLIEDSRQPVPDPMLDEQDRVEEICGKDLEAVGKFVMSVVMQWKKADELYVETSRDHGAAQSLIDDIKRALKQPPVRRNEIAFSSRIDMLARRLSSRTNPASSVTTFPLPRHPLFPDQISFNNDIVRILASELDTARASVANATDLVKAYRAGCEAVEKAEDLRNSMKTLRTQLSTSVSRLQNGVPSDDGDGTPPDLAQTSCVEPLRFSSYLAMLPACSEEIVQLEHTAGQTVKRARLLVVGLSKPGIDSQYIQTISAEVDDLESESQRAANIRRDMLTRVTLLREVRRIWATMEDISKSLDLVLSEVKEALMKFRWREETGRDNTPLTPESPRLTLPPDHSISLTIQQQLQEIQDQVINGLLTPLGSIHHSLPQVLYNFLENKYHYVSDLLLDLQKMDALSLEVRRQSSAMEVVREEVHSIASRIEEIRTSYEEHFQDMMSQQPLSGLSVPTTALSDEEIESREKALTSMVDTVRKDLMTLTDSLPTRIPFTSTDQHQGNLDLSLYKESVTLTSTRSKFLSRLPFDPASSDRIVRSDSNTYVMRLSGDLKLLLQKQSYCGFYRTARVVSQQLANLRGATRAFQGRLDDIDSKFRSLNDPDLHLDESEAILPNLTSLKDELEVLSRTDKSVISQTISSIRGDVTKMRNVTGVQDDITNLSALSSRAAELDDLDLQTHRLFARLESLKGEFVGLEQVQISALAKRAQEEEARADAETKAKDNAKARRQAEAELETQRQSQQEDTARGSTPEASIRLAAIDEVDHLQTNVDETLGTDGQMQLQQDRRTMADPSQNDAEGEREAVNASIDTALTADKSPPNYASNEDVFGPHLKSRTKEDLQLDGLKYIQGLRKRFISLGIDAMAHPPRESHRASSASLPTAEKASDLAIQFASLEHDINSISHPTGGLALTELQSLHEDIKSSRVNVRRIEQLGRLSSAVVLCDKIFSEFLDHIDSYPLQPQTDGGGVVVLEVDSKLSSEEQLQERMSYAKGIVGDMAEQYRPVADDHRAVTEHDRLKQTWEELTEMAMEKINGCSSRPASVSAHSSGRNSSASMNSYHIPDAKRSLFSKLSAGNRDRIFLGPSQRRTLSTSTSTKPQQTQASRSSLNISRPTQRSVSGPMSPPSSSTLYSSTFASRQRTTSMSSTTSSVMSGGRPHAMPGLSNRRTSSTVLDSPRVGSPTVSTSSRGTWSRTPRLSFGSLPRPSTPDRNTGRRKQRYVADPKNKLDVAVGDVVNNLPVDINVEVVADTWKDKSGKYWIGGADPKLCFCRILRSQTVMVRVGGGWSELSKFIKDHFADLFRLIPESPPRLGSREEKWISASTLRHAPNETLDITQPQTPEHASGFLPTFAVSTPDGSLTTSMLSTSTPGVSLTPLQFLRRADADPSDFSLSSFTGSAVALSTPSKAPSIRTKGSAPNTPSKQAIWRP